MKINTVFTGSNLPSSAPFQSQLAKSGPVGFFEYDTASGATVDGSNNITGMTDLGGSTNTLVQGTPAAQPVLSPGAINGLSAGLFDGTKRQVLTAGALDVTKPFTIALVYKPRSGSAASYVMGYWSAAGAGLVLLQNANDTLQFSLGAGLITFPSVRGSWGLAILSSTSSVLKARVNGKTYAAAATNNNGPAAGSNFVVGGLNNINGGAFFDGMIADVLFWQSDLTVGNPAMVGLLERFSNVVYGSTYTPFGG